MKLESLKSSKFEAMTKSQMNDINGGDLGQWSKTTPLGHWQDRSYEDWAFSKDGRETCREYKMNDGTTQEFHWTN